MASENPRESELSSDDEGPSPKHVLVENFGAGDADRPRRSRSETTDDDTAEDANLPSAPSIIKEGFDLEKFLREKIEQRKAEDIPGRTLGVMFRGLRVTAAVPSSNEQPTLASTFSPSQLLECIRAMRNPATREILSEFEGVIRPGEMLLVLGRPGSGCSTLLKTLANQTAEYHSVAGERHYDSLSPEEIEKIYRGDVTYCPEDDIHFPTLTVEQTLSFAAKTRTPHQRVGGIDREEYIRILTDTLMTVFGLRHAKDTPVGDASIRGVSGGEKKRVSICEVLAAATRLGAWDNSTRGLDSSTALEFVRALRLATDLGSLTTIVSIYQTSESIYQLFDKVCVINEGKMVYFGRADEARYYFEGLGYTPAYRQTTADFLVAVTDPNARIPIPEHPFPQPRTADDFVRAFRASPQGDANDREVEAYRREFVGKPELVQAYEKSANTDRANHTRKNDAYMISLPMQVRAVMIRRWQIIRGDVAGQISQAFSYIIQAIIVGTVFFKVPGSTSGLFSRGSVLFFSVLNGAITAMAEIPSLYSQRPILLRHMKAAMYRPFVDALALTLVDIPVTLATNAIFTLVLYFLVGLQKSASQFFVFLVFSTAITLAMKSFFRMVAAAFKREAGAQSVGGLVFLMCILYTGYTIPKPDMTGALRWLTFINPVRYGFEGLLTNEFHTLNVVCDSLVPQGPGYENVSLTNQACAIVGSLSGQQTVNGNRFVELSFAYSYGNLWRNFGILVAFAIGFLAFYLFLTESNIYFASAVSVTLFKRGSKAKLQAQATDEEKSELGGQTLPVVSGEETDVSNPTPIVPGMADVFTWRHIAYEVPVAGGSLRLLLDDISGFVAPGKLTALMGESGAGKTTLLNVLAQRQDVGVVTGELLVNGQTLPADFQSQTGYCQQTDTHVPEQTVREALLFSAKLRQPQSVSLAEKEAYVETCLKMCGLEPWADAIVGTLGVEHRKRTTIGVELAAKPKLLLFLDEPTSGLDSQSAWAITKFLRFLADHGQAILCTIHQPSGELFQVFDRLLLLRKGGQTVYFGDIGLNCKTLTDYFEANGGRRCGTSENPAEWMLDIIGAGATASSPIDWHEVWQKSPEASQVQEQLNRLHENAHSRPQAMTATKSTYATSWIYQFSTLVARNAQSYWRNPTYLISKIVLNAAAGLFIGFTFFRSKNTLRGVQNQIFAIYMGLVVAAPLSNQLQVLFIQSRNIHEIRERPSRMYSWSAFVASHLVVEIGWNIFSSTFYFLTWYWTVAFPSERAGYTFLMLSVAFPAFFTTLSQAVAAAAPNPLIAALFFSLFFSFATIFNGVLQPFSQLGWWKWMYHVSPFTYVIEGLLGQAIAGQAITCAQNEFAIVEPPHGKTCIDYLGPFISFAGGYVQNSDATSACRYCSVSSTDQLMASAYNIFYSHRWRDVGIVFGFALFNVVATFVAMYLFRIRKGSVFRDLKTYVRGLAARRQ